jgi:hypothetical protein
MKHINQLTFANILLERFINLHTPQDMSKYIDVIWEILQDSYVSIGGFKSATDKEDLMRKSGLTKLVTKGGKVIAVKIYKDELGRKSIAGGSDGSDEGKKWFIKICEEDIKLNRAWGEVSGAIEHIMLKRGSVPIPNSMVAHILGKPVISLDPDGYHYTREIQGEPHTKIMIGDLDKLLATLQAGK